MAETNWGPHTLTIDESQRQLLLMALAMLAVERPGFNEALAEIAIKVDNNVRGKAKMFEAFKELRSPPAGEVAGA